MLRWTALILLSVPAIAVSAQQRVDHRLQKPFIVVSDSYWADYSERTGKSRPTSISIYRDGFVDLQLPSAGDASAWVDKRELDALNAYLNAIDWSRLTTKSVEKAVDGAPEAAPRETKKTLPDGTVITSSWIPRVPVVTDGSTTTIVLRKPLKPHSVSVRELGMLEDIVPSVEEVRTLSNAMRKIYRAAGLGTDGVPLPPLGQQELHEQFGAILLRMTGQHRMTYDEFYKRRRVFALQLTELGDEKFADALAKESPEVIAAVGFILSRRNEVTREGATTEASETKPQEEDGSLMDNWFRDMLGSLADQYPRTKAVIGSVPVVKFPARFMTTEEEREFYGTE